MLTFHFTFHSRAAHNRRAILLSSNRVVERLLSQTSAKTANFYRPRSEASDSYIFTGICLSNSRGGGEVGNHGPGHNTSLPPPGHRSQHPPPRAQVTTPPSPFWGTGHNTSLPPPGTMRRRAVRILLECILVTTGIQ